MKTLIINTKLYKNPYFIFAPFLLLYLVIAIVFYNEVKSCDEPRYIMYAENLINGFYSPPPPGIILTSSPGYPIILMPIIGLNLPGIFIGILNALLYYLSIILLFKGLLIFANYRISLLISLFWACYINNYEFIPTAMMEIFTIFLISLLIYSLIRAFNLNSNKNSKPFLLISGLTFGYIVLTKFIFGYILLIMIIGTTILWILNRKSINYRKGIFILIIAFVINIPYLIYTYNLTGKVLYWGTAAGDTLYWMSTPYEGEYGDWRSFVSSEWNEKNSLVTNHQQDRDKISRINQATDDDLLKQMAINNIKSHPLKYLQNIGCNIGRMLFNYPYSYAKQSPKALLRIPHNAILCVFLLFSLVPTYLNWRKIPFVIRFLLFMTLIYLGGSSLSSAYPRMFTVIVPILLVWIAYILQNTIHINLNFKENP